MSKLLSLDQSSRVSGWAYFDNGELKDFGKFEADQTDIGERLLFIKQNIISLFNKYDIEEVAFEDIQLQNNVLNNVQTFKTLAEVFGVIYELVTELKIPHNAVMSSSWKSTLGIKGRTRPEQKRNAQAYVLETYGVKCTQDEADAICIGSHIIKQSDPAIAGFDWSN